jgi:Ala-tRNA(Pro) deacylase
MSLLSRLLSREEPPPPIESYLRDQHVSFSLHHHPPTYSAQRLAHIEHVPGRMVAKVVMAVVDEELVMLCVPAPCHVNMLKLMNMLATDNVRLAQEEDFSDAFPDCEVGAMPPFGNLYEIPVYVDKQLAEDERIHFQACRHTDTVEMSYSDFARLAHPIVCELS